MIADDNGVSSKGMSLSHMQGRVHVIDTDGNHEVFYAIINGKFTLTYIGRTPEPDREYKEITIELGSCFPEYSI